MAGKTKSLDVTSLKKKRAENSRQLCLYGQTKAEYDAQYKKQGEKCSICGRKKKNVSLHQDHTHRIAKLKIRVKKDGERWRAYNEEYGYAYVSSNKKKAKREVLRRLRRRSRRGILCWKCNTALKKFEDNPRTMFEAAKYLTYWQKKQGWDYAKKQRLKHD